MGAIDAIRDEARATLFEVLVCMAWADKKLAEDEKAAVRAAAMALGLVNPRDHVLDSLERGALPIEQLPFEWLKPREREIAYLCAAWMVLADGETAPDEVKTLEKLRHALGVDSVRAGWLRQRALQLRSASAPTPSWWRPVPRRSRPCCCSPAPTPAGPVPRPASGCSAALAGC